MNIIQASAPKSGSYWLYTILNLILDKGGYPHKSFIQQQPVYAEARNWELSYKEQAGIDMLDIEEEGCFYRISSAFRNSVDDIRSYAQSCSQAWTHSTVCNRSFNVLPHFKKVVYIIRDPRDRALSAARFALSPYMQKFYPTSHSSVSEYLESNFETLMERWVWHVANYIYQQEALNVHLIFYERLLKNFDQELQNLLNYLGVELSKKDQQEIAREVSFSSMKQEAPGHVKKGKYGKWMEELTPFQKKKAIEIAGPLLGMLSYPLKEKPSGKKVPSYKGGENNRDQLKKIIEQTEWYPLYN